MGNRKNLNPADHKAHLENCEFCGATSQNLFQIWWHNTDVIISVMGVKYRTDHQNQNKKDSGEWTMLLVSVVSCKGTLRSWNNNPGLETTLRFFSCPLSRTSVLKWQRKNGEKHSAKVLLGWVISSLYHIPSCSGENVAREATSEWQRRK